MYIFPNNLANLVLDSEAESSVIGSLAYNIDTILDSDDGLLEKAFIEFNKDKEKYLLSKASGFEQTIQSEIMKIVSSFPSPDNVNKFRSFLEMLYDNTVVDIMTKETLPSHAAKILELYGRFVASGSTGDLDSLYGAAMTYVLYGVNFAECPYPKIW